MSDMDHGTWLGNDEPRCERCHAELHDCDCPSDLDAPALCLHGREMGGHRYCPDCAVAAETMLAGALAQMLARIQREQDETMGAALAARYEKGEAS